MSGALEYSLPGGQRPQVRNRQGRPAARADDRIGLKNLREFEPLANSPLDAITGDKIAAFIAKRRQAGLAIATINRGGHRIGHSESETAESRKPSAVTISNNSKEISGRGEWIRTTDLLVPNQAL